MKYSIINKDIADAMKDMPDNSFDAVFCDPPYEIAFMSKKWDDSGIAFKVETWVDILRVLKPGGHAFAFGGARTHHRLMVAMEDAGFELREVLMYCFGSGFPKSLDVGKKNKEWDGHGSALKPAYEPCILARKPLTGTIANNCLEHGCGGLWIDGGRVDAEPRKICNYESTGAQGCITHTGVAGHNGQDYSERIETKGRFPANLILDSSPEVEDCFPHTKSGKPGIIRGGKNNGAAYGSEIRKPGTKMTGIGDSGSASRFFQHCDFTPEELEEYRCIYYTAKASQKERNAGLEGFEDKPCACMQGNMIDGQRLTGNGKPIKTPVRKNIHPTVKPLSLCTYLTKLILPPAGRPQGPRRILVPFSGSGSEMIGAGMAGWDEVVGIEKEPEYVEIARARLAHWMNKEEQLSLFNP